MWHWIKFPPGIDINHATVWCNCVMQILATGAKQDLTRFNSRHLLKLVSHLNQLEHHDKGLLLAVTQDLEGNQPTSPHSFLLISWITLRKPASGILEIIAYQPTNFCKYSKTLPSEMLLKGNSRLRETPFRDTNTQFLQNHIPNKWTLHLRGALSKGTDTVHLSRCYCTEVTWIIKLSGRQGSVRLWRVSRLDQDW